MIFQSNLNEMKSRKRDCIITSVFIVGILTLFLIFNSIFSFFPILQYRENAIIIIIGDIGTFNDSNYDDEFLSEKYKEYWELRVEELKVHTSWKIYFCHEKTFNFQLSSFTNLLLIIEGHGSFSDYYHSHYIIINENNRIYANELQPRCKNLTLIVDSCYSNHWHSDFNHAGLNGLFTSDLSYNLSYFRYQIGFKPDYNMTIQRFDRFYLDSFLKGFSYQKANETAWINMTYFGLA